jgi:EAL domain-containing protein (putative c-di-GMP-specific phosphodiesterase class I)
MELAAIPDEMIKQSNVALAEAKRGGRGAHRVYAADIADRERNRAVMRLSLRRALDEEQFALQYQPLVELGTGRILGAEALVRWDHPELGRQRPDLFIPLAETSGQIVPLGAWILRAALREQREWERLGAMAPRMAVNLSSVQLRDPGFMAMVAGTLKETGANPGKIDLELTESVLIDISNQTHGILKDLKNFGFGLALDDFGTGYSSFRYLRDLPIDKVKIDQTFVRDMDMNAGDAAIVRAIVTVAKSLDLAVIAEGIETTGQRDLLRAEGCGMGQGYLFSRPVPAEEFRRFLEGRVTLPVGEQRAAAAS